MPKRKFECPVCHETIQLTGKNLIVLNAGRNLWLEGHKHLELIERLPKPPDDMPVSELPDQYMDPQGRVWVLCGCGHYAGGALMWYGEKMNFCPNCGILSYISIVRPDRMTNRK